MRVMALPMHGEVKLRREGLRTRDAHLMEHLAAMGTDIVVRSRAEPFPRLSIARWRGSEPVPATWKWVSPQVLTVPPLRERQRWWVESVRREPASDLGLIDALLVWNPLLGSSICAEAPHLPVVFDLLDDWTVHAQFSGIQEHIDRAYSRMFESADHVFANSEATLDLAGRYGRTDATLMANGCDPVRFQLDDRRCGGRVVVGYGGKLGGRVDRGLIEQTARAFTSVDFELAGPILERGWDRPLRRLPNVRLLGDVPYSRYPEVVAGWDVGWVPHRVGLGEVGGDAIKIYEYRAAGLPTLTTPIIGSHRALQGVRVAPADEHGDILQHLLEIHSPNRVPREPMTIPTEMTWRHKARLISKAIGA